LNQLMAYEKNNMGTGTNTLNENNENKPSWLCYDIIYKYIFFKFVYIFNINIYIIKLKYISKFYVFIFKIFYKYKFN
jgi:hypothetical protein